MKDFIKSIISNIFANIIIFVVGFIVSIILAIIKPFLWPHIIIFLIMLSLFMVVLIYKAFGTAKFKWKYIQALEKHTMSLQKNNSGSDTQFFKTIKCKKFEGKVEGFYEWSDVSVNKVSINAQDATLNLVSKDAKNKEHISSGKENVALSNDPLSAHYNIQFYNNKPVDVRLVAEFNYDPEIMEPIYYFEVSRPVFKLVVELQVDVGVRLHNVKKCISSDYADGKNTRTTTLKPKKSKENPSTTIYRFTVYNPKILHNYGITWNWRE